MASRTGTWRHLLLLAAVTLGGCSARTRAIELYPDVAEQSGKRISSVDFVNPEPFDADTLLTIMQTLPSRCNFLGLPVCVPFTRIGREEHRLSPTRVVSDVETLERFYRIAGYFGTRVTPSVDEDGDDVDVTFTIDRGDAVVLDVLTVTGTEPVLAPDSLAATLPLTPGDIFHLGRFIESSDRVLNELRARGHAYADVFRSFSVDTIDNRAEAALDFVPGPQVRVDSVMLRGAENLGRRDALRQLEFRPGDLLRTSRLVESQRNLYGLELVSLAAVTVAPDSLQANPSDSTTATVLVTLAEAPVHEIEAAAGFGTFDCLRTEASWVNRSFGRGARRLALRGSLSRLGAGDPFSFSGGERVCGREPSDTLFGGTRFDYRVSADFTQPYFIGPRNQLGVAAFSERVSEPGVFSRTATGASVAVSRRLAARSGIALSIEARRTQTRATAALFCAAFLVCEPTTIDSLSIPRFRTDLIANYFLDATNAPLEPTGGYLVRSGIKWAAPLPGSDLQFFRLTGDGSHYRELRPGWVAAATLRIGNFFQTATLTPGQNFLPPEERFYAGGASSVRGFDRNRLGPGVYVTDSDSLVVEDGDTTLYRDPVFVATGGTALAVASVEFRMPSPFLADRLRLAAFVDGGAIGTSSLWDLGISEWRFTPGVGIRLQTPIGPVRLDMAYNGYDEPTGPLLFSDVNTGVVRRLAEDYQAPTGNFFSRLKLHLGVGHAF